MNKLTLRKPFSNEFGRFCVMLHECTLLLYKIILNSVIQEQFLASFHRNSDLKTFEDSQEKILMVALDDTRDLILRSFPKLSEITLPDNHWIASFKYLLLWHVCTLVALFILPWSLFFLMESRNKFINQTKKVLYLRCNDRHLNGYSWTLITQL